MFDNALSNKCILSASNRHVSFVRPGQRSFYKQKQPTLKDPRWDGNWNISADLPGHQGLFPIPTKKKPEIVVWCPQRKIAHLVELTVPYEDNIDATQVRKDGRYERLLNDWEGAGWIASHLSIEVGCRGFVGNQLRQWFSTIGLNARQRIVAIKELQETVQKASHWIWLKRNDNEWLEK